MDRRFLALWFLATPHITMSLAILGLTLEMVLGLGRASGQPLAMRLMSLPLGLSLGAAALATAYGLVSRRRAPFYASAGVTMLLLFSAMVGSFAGSRLGGPVLLLGLVLFALHIYAYPALRPPKKPDDNGEQP